MTEPLRVKGGELFGRRYTPDIRSPSYTNAAALVLVTGSDDEREAGGCAIMMLQPAIHVPPVEAARAETMEDTSARDLALASKFLWVQPSLVALYPKGARDENG